MERITILALHMGTGGIENSIATLSNMLCEKYEVEIISTYKLQEEPSFQIDDRVKIRYLLPPLIKPNKQEFKQAIKTKNVFKILKEAIVAMRVLFLRKSKMIKAIKECDSNIIISTRTIHNRWLGKYGNKNSLKIAQEHNHHNNNQKYIKEVLSSIKKIDIFMPVSKELTGFYKEKIKKNKPICKYIPHALEKFPDRVSDLSGKKIISVRKTGKV